MRPLFLTLEEARDVLGPVRWDTKVLDSGNLCSKKAAAWDSHLSPALEI